MDHIRLLNQLRNRQTISLAFDYAYNDRFEVDYYFDYFEIEYVRANRAAIIDEIVVELHNPESFISRTAYAYYLPKTDLCYRRMIYIPFKDLVIRYAFIIVISDHTDGDLSHKCFANRRSKGQAAKKHLLDDYAKVSWPNFCRWQKESALKYRVLLKTDISSFYDSISHDYLNQITAKELSISTDSEFMALFRKLLCIRVESYSHSSQKLQEIEETKQGLPIGNNTEGFLANLYLKDIDNVMDGIETIEFGRYNDDMRIFGNSHSEVLSAVRILQELLLTKGLNLNAGKTRIAMNEEELEELRSKSHDVYDYFIVEDLESGQQSDPSEGLLEEIDILFDEFDRVFEPDTELSENKDAKEYCKFLGNHELLPHSNRTPSHIDTLGVILRKWQGSGKHASWLLVQSATWNTFSRETKVASIKTLFSSLQSDKVDSYIKYRLLHHLVRLRAYPTEHRYLDLFSATQKEQMKAILPSIVKYAAFELNLIGLYTLRLLNLSEDKFRDIAYKYPPKPIGEPIRNALSYISEPHLEPFDLPISIEQEPDEKPQPY